MIRVVTPPAAYPVTLAEAKEWCRVESDDASQDLTLRRLIAATTNRAENELTGRAYVERTLELNLDHEEYWAMQNAAVRDGRFDQWYTCGRPYIELPFPPLLSVHSITYTDINGDAQMWDSALYEVDAISEPARIRPVQGARWPAVRHGFNVFRVLFQAGYRPTGSPIDLTDTDYLPAELGVWMNALLCTMFENREQYAEGRLLLVPRSFVDAWLDNLVVATRLF